MLPHARQSRKLCGILGLQGCSERMWIGILGLGSPNLPGPTHCETLNRDGFKIRYFVFLTSIRLRPSGCWMSLKPLASLLGHREWERLLVGASGAWSPGFKDEKWGAPRC